MLSPINKTLTQAAPRLRSENQEGTNDMTNETEDRSVPNVQNMGKLMRINAQMFEGTIHVLIEQNTAMLLQYIALHQQAGEVSEDVWKHVVSLTGVDTQMFRETIRVLSQKNLELHQQLAQLTVSKAGVPPALGAVLSGKQ